MSCNLTLHVGNSNVIELQELTNSVTEAVDTGATVTVTMYDADDDEVLGQVWPASMAHDSGGTYRVTLDDGIAITGGSRYRATVDATGSGGEIGQWDCYVTAKTRISGNC